MTPTHIQNYSYLSLLLLLLYSLLLPVSPSKTSVDEAPPSSKKPGGGYGGGAGQSSSGGGVLRGGRGISTGAGGKDSNEEAPLSKHIQYPVDGYCGSAIAPIIIATF